MVRFFIVILFLLPSYIACAQHEYSHDGNGNRIKRFYKRPLPVTLVRFTAEKSTGDQMQPSALLTWRTASEVNSDHFEIQRSRDGRAWSALGTVQASGDKASDSDYSFIDQAPMDGENLYRLKMVDRDQTFAYSRMQNLDFGSLTVFYPNPVKDRLRIKGVLAGEVGSCKIKIWDATGKLVGHSTGVPVGGIDMTFLPTGIYTVNITYSNGTSIVRKIVKE